MTQEEKELLMRDLCARLSYGIKCRICGDKEFPQDKTIDEELTLSGYKAFVDTMNCFAVNPFFVKPYLRPLSSMMQGEWEEMTALIYPYGRVNRNPDNKDELLLWLSTEGNEMPIMLMDNVFSWLDKNMFDYRGLIEKGLALEAPDSMYKHFGDMDVVVTSVKHKYKL